MSRARRGVGKGGAEAAKRRDAAARPAASRRADVRRAGRLAGERAGSRGGGAIPIPAVRSCIVSIAPNMPTRFAICWRSTSMPSALLPPDDSSSGFDNIADVLGVSPALMERYLSAADRSARWPSAIRRSGPVRSTYHVRADDRRNRITLTGCRSARAAGCWSARRCRSTASTSSRSSCCRPISVRCAASNTRSSSRSSVDGARVHLVPMGGPADFAILPENADRDRAKRSTRGWPCACRRRRVRDAIAATFLQKTDRPGRLPHCRRSCAATSMRPITPGCRTSRA